MLRNTAYKILCVAGCVSLIFAVGCSDGYSDADQAELEENVVEVPDESPKEEKEEVKEDRAGQTDLQKEMVVETPDEPLEKAKEEQRELEEAVAETLDEPSEYSSFMWKSWIVDEPVSWDDKFGFIITKMRGEEIEGVIVIGGDADYWYWDWYCEKYSLFQGIVKEGQAECTFEYEGYPSEVTFFFQGDNRIEAIVKCDQLDMDMCHEFRPQHFSDIDVSWNDDLSSAPVYLETWGEVNLISATTDINHSYPFFCITDEEGNILCEDSCINGFVFWDIFVEDLNHDGLQDIWTVLCGSVDNGLKECGLVYIFYQTEDGRFIKEWRTMSNGLPREYFGEYQVTRFCPTGNYVDISETVLTQEEADQMTKKVIVVQKDLFVSYDSERRRGIREERKPPARESMITEYRDTYPEYYWRSLPTDMSSSETYPDEELRKAVGEEYYEKINGVFYDIYSAWQLFYTLEGEDKLIMHSMLTGQNFILEKEVE